MSSQKSVPVMRKGKPSASSNDNTPRLCALFGPPPLLEGEDPEAYNELLGRFTATVKPADIFEEIWVLDIVSLTWEIFRWRRLQPRVIQINTKVGARVLLKQCEPFEIINDSSDHEEDTDPSDHEEATDPSDLEDGTDPDLGDDTDPSEDEEQYSPYANEFLAEGFAAGCPKAIKKVKERLASGNLTIDSIMAYGLAAGISEIKRIDHMAMQAEKRRDRILHEIESYRAGFGKALRSAIEDAEFDPAEAPQIEDKAA